MARKAARTGERTWGPEGEVRVSFAEGDTQQWCAACDVDGAVAYFPTKAEAVEEGRRMAYRHGLIAQDPDAEAERKRQDRQACFVGALAAAERALKAGARHAVYAVGNGREVTVLRVSAFDTDKAFHAYAAVLFADGARTVYALHAA